jgi:carbamoyl-phosphate synthase large subunit
MNIVDMEKPDGVIVQFGGQTPLNLAKRLQEAGVPIIGTSVDSIEGAENRQKFAKIVDELGLLQPANGSAFSVEDALHIARTIGYPVLARPSFVLGGRAMRIVYNDDALLSFIEQAKEVSEGHPVLIDKFIEDAIEVDVDAISDGQDTFVAGIMEHIENAGIHSGDSACVIPPPTLSEELIERIKDLAIKISAKLHVIGLMNIQFAVKGRQIFVLEVNPRASRTSPFVSKATGIPLAKIASQIMAGKKLSDFNLSYDTINNLKHYSVKESVLPFSRFSGVDIVLGPEMKSTGEVMGTGTTFGEAFAKSQIAAGQHLPKEGKVFISVKDEDKRAIVMIAKKFIDMGFGIVSTQGTAKVLRSFGVEVEIVARYDRGQAEGVNAITMIANKELTLIINTPEAGESSQTDMRAIRSAAILHDVPYVTTLQGALAAVNAVESRRSKRFTVRSLQELYMARDGKIEI